MSKKEKKEKVIYVDDGRTIADMSNVNGLKKPKSPTQAPRPEYLGTQKSTGTFKERWNTYWSAVKMMFVPMLITIGIICVAFLATWLFFNFAG